jgi:serine/threonine protein kinase
MCKEDGQCEWIADIARYLHAGQATLLTINWPSGSGTQFLHQVFRMTVSLKGNVNVSRLLARFQKIGALMDSEGQSVSTEALTGPEAQTLEGQLVDGIYRIVGEIGNGTHGTVFRATDEILRRNVALKIVSEFSLVNNPRVQERFHKEAKVLSTLNHQNVVQIFRCGLLPDNSPFLVMEYLDGKTLAEYLKDEACPPLQTTLQIALGIAAGMEHIHSCNVIHRDLKPSNVIINENRFPKILDFGISQVLATDENGKQDTTRCSFKGSAAYASPEQARGEVVDGRSDIYAFSVMLFEMLSGERPFTADNQAQLLMKHLQEDAPKLAASGAKTRGYSILSRKLIQIVERGLKKNKEERYQTFGELVKDLTQAQAIYSQQTGKTAISFAPERTASRDKSSKALQIFAVLGSVACLTAFIVWSILGTTIQDDYYLDKVAPAKSIKYLSSRVDGLLKKSDFEQAKKLVEKSTNTAYTPDWSRDDHMALLKSYFYLYKSYDQNQPAIRKETLRLALDYYSDLLHWGREYHRPKSKRTQSEFRSWKTALLDVGEYLWKESNRSKNWEPIALLFSKHPKSIPTSNGDYYQLAATLRERAEEYSRQKSGVDADLLSEHCVQLLRIVAQKRGDGTLAEAIATGKRVIPFLKKYGQAKDVNLLNCELALVCLDNNKYELADEYRKSLRSSEVFFGFRTDEVFPYMLMEATFGIFNCKRKEKEKALEQLMISEDTLMKQYNPQIYRTLVSIPPKKGDKVTFKYELTPEQEKLISNENAYLPVYRLRRAIEDTFGKECLKPPA